MSHRQNAVSINWTTAIDENFSNSEDYTLEMNAIETIFFDPTDEYVFERLKSPEVAEYVKKSKIVYMVIGLKIAHGIVHEPRADDLIFAYRLYEIKWSWWKRDFVTSVYIKGIII
jgi:hypothetical protein